jgi:hypothetical protein
MQFVKYDFDPEEPLGFLVLECFELLEKNKDIPVRDIAELKRELQYPAADVAHKMTELPPNLRCELNGLLFGVCQKEGYEPELEYEFNEAKGTHEIILEVSLSCLGHPVSSLTQSRPPKMKFSIATLQDPGFHLENISTAFTASPGMAIQVPVKDFPQFFHERYLELMEPELEALTQIGTYLDLSSIPDKEPRVKRLFRNLFPNEEVSPGHASSWVVLSPDWHRQLRAAISRMHGTSA